MNSFESLKNWLWVRSLKSRQDDQSPIVIPTINPSKKVGILFDATRETNRKSINNFCNKLRGRGCNVTLLGYINKNLKHNLFDFLIYHKGMINWYGIPGSSDIDRFISNDIDILINFDTEDRKHLHYISALCRAKFKVSMAHKNGIPYHLILESKFQDDLNDVILELEIQLRKISI